MLIISRKTRSKVAAVVVAVLLAALLQAAAAPLVLGQDAANDELLVYKDGRYWFFNPSPTGTFVNDRSGSGWSQDWTFTPIEFDGTPGDEILLYNAVTGRRALYQTSPSGGLGEKIWDANWAPGLTITALEYDRDAGDDLASQPVGTGSRPDFQLPFSCGSSWTATTYDIGSIAATGRSWNHENYLDFGQIGAGGSDVFASADGFAQLVDAAEGKVVVDHGNGWSTVYQHMGAITVSSTGQPVEQGQKLGVIFDGQQGTSTGAHLHYAQLENGEAQPPLFDGSGYSWTNGQAVTVGSYRFTNSRSSTSAITGGLCG